MDPERVASRAVPLPSRPKVPRLCGLGDVDWPDFFSGLYRTGYDGPVIIEHEDRLFEGSVEKIRRGFLLARDVLQPFIK